MAAGWKITLQVEVNMPFPEFLGPGQALVTASDRVRQQLDVATRLGAEVISAKAEWFDDDSSES